MPRVGIVGCGLIGRKRAAALCGAELRACADVVHERAVALAASVAGARAIDWPLLVRAADIDIVVVATTNNALAEVTQAALAAGKHVLVEKPAARTVAELEPVIGDAARYKRVVRVGFNHRYHLAMMRAREIIDAGSLGPMMVVRGRYGHGGRLGYEREWRANPEISGGGELIDQGVHLIDLARWYLGEELTEVTGHAATLYWNMAADDNAFMTLRTESGSTAFLHVSCSEWKNLFSLEIYGRNGKLHIEGLGGSYGLERLTFYRMLPQMGPPETEVWEYPGPDGSWQREFTEFLDDIAENRTPSAGLKEARASLAIVDEIYRHSAVPRLIRDR